MTDLIVRTQTKPLAGSVPVASDKSIAHRALIVAALAEGRSTLRRAVLGEDNRSTLGALHALGVKSELHPHDLSLAIEGVGLYGLSAPSAALDCGNSGTTMRLLAGLLAGQSFASRLIGDASLSSRPMRRIVDPLRARGARVNGAPHPKKEGEIVAPLDIEPLGEGEYLTGLELDSPVASAQVKSAALLSGLFAHGPTYVREPAVSRDHTERMLAAAGVPIRRAGATLELDPAGWDGRIAPLDLVLPGDLSAAAFLITAAQLVEGSFVTVRDVGLNPTRTGFLEIARDMGVGLEIEPHGESGGEPIGYLRVRPAPLVATRIGGELLLRAIDEVPIACALAARATGTTVIRDAAELRVKESDRIAAMVRLLAAFGVTAEERPDGLAVTGRAGPLTAAEVHSGGDHRIAMTAAVLGLVADGVTRVRDVDCIGTSYPRFVGTMRALGAAIDVA